MSADGQTLPPPCSPVPAGAVDGLRGLDPQSSPQAEMETLRRFLNERLTAAVDDILGVFVKTVTRYREQIDHQRRQLDDLRSAEGERSRAAGLSASPSHDLLQVSSWIKKCPSDQMVKIQPEQMDSTEESDTIISAAHIKTEVGGGDCGALEPSDGFDPACGSEGADDGGLLAESSETEDSGDCWREDTGLWKQEETEEGEEQSSYQSVTVKNSSHLPQQPSPTFICRVCGKPFQRISYLLTHARAHSTDCGLCGKHLGQSENLKLHLRVHREASFRCGVCGQSFTLRGNLRVHMRIHSGERPHGCTVCGKSFGRRATLVRHVRNHTGEKPFTCTHCGRGFVEKGNLTVHLRTHTGERPYWCSVCDRRFRQLSCFYKHPCQRSPTGDRPKS